MIQRARFLDGSEFSAGTFAAGVQWLLFMFANTVVIPVSVGHALHLEPAQLTVFTERSFAFTGVACLLQWAVGHRMPLMEGQSGVWWGVILGVLATSVQTGVSLRLAGGSLETGFILSGLLIMAAGLAGAGRVLRAMFTPAAMAVFLFLLAVVLCSIFFRGMLGMGAGGPINGPVAALSLFLVILVLAVQLRGPARLRNFAVLIGVGVGVALYRTAFPGEGSAPAPPAAWTLFGWGPPAFVPGIVFTALVAGLLNTSNTVATLESAGALLSRRPGGREYRRSLLVTGFNTLASGFLAVVPYAPYTSSIGFLRTTQIFSGMPFAIGAFLFFLLGLWPAAGSFFSALPASVGDAVLFVAYLQLFGSAFEYLDRAGPGHRAVYRVALPVMVGVALLGTPSSAFGSVPAFLRTFVENGLLVGVTLSLLIENAGRLRLARFFR